MKTVSILGCGWLGFPLAQKLAKSYHVKVSTTTLTKLKKLQENGLEAFLLSETNQETLSTFLKCDILIIAVPPSKFDNLKAFMQHVISYNKASKTIFISSTSVYDNVNQSCYEYSLIQKPMNETLYATEQLFHEKTDVVLRCAGLMGYNRVIGRYSHQKIVTAALKKTNYVHVDDVIKAIVFILDNNIEGIFNLCSKLHYTKEEIYRFIAKQYAYEFVDFTYELRTNNRIINSDKLRNLGFVYEFDDAKEFYVNKRVL